MCGQGQGASLLRVHVADVSGSVSPVAITVRQVISDWEEGAVTWSSKPSVNPMGLASVNVSGAGWISFEITTLVQAWYLGEANQGIELGAPLVTDYAVSLDAREGSHPPELVVTYEPATGTATSTPLLTPTPPTAPTRSSRIRTRKSARPPP